MKKLQGMQKLVATGAIIGSATGGLFAVGGVVAGAQAQPVAITAVSADADDLGMTPADFLAAQQDVTTTEAPRGVPATVAPPIEPVAPSSTTQPTTTTVAPTTTAAPQPTTTVAPATTTTAPAPTTTAPAAPTTTKAPTPTTAPAEEPAATTPDSGSFDTDCEATLVDLMNDERVDAGMSPVTHDVRGQRVARRWTDHMTRSGTLAHNPKFGEELTAEGIHWSGAAENVAYNYSAEATHQAFMGSSGHRANIMNPDYTGVGVGCAYDDDGTLWVTQNFWF